MGRTFFLISLDTGNVIPTPMGKSPPLVIKVILGDISG